MTMDKITMHIFKRNFYGNKFLSKLSNAYIRVGGGGGGVHMNIFKKIEELIPTHSSMGARPM